jgi:hypothetical protein
MGARALLPGVGLILIIYLHLVRELGMVKPYLYSLTRLLVEVLNELSRGTTANLPHLKIPSDRI